MLSKRMFISLILAICLLTFLFAQNFSYAALILDGQLFLDGEKLSAEKTIRMTLRIYDDEFAGQVLFEENQEVAVGTGKSLFTFEKGEIVVKKRASELTTESMWVEVESNDQVMTPRLNLAEIGTVRDLAGSSLSLVETSLRTAGEPTLVISENGIILGGLLDMGSESIRLGTVTRSTWSAGGSGDYTETDPTVPSSVKDGISWSEISNKPAGFADGIDNNSGGDITGVTAGNGLSGGGSSASVSLSVSVPLNLSHSVSSGSVGSQGAVISGENSYSGSYNNTFGGYFTASGSKGKGVYGGATGSSGRGVNGNATAVGNVQNYGGSFFASGDKARGVYGEASSTATGGPNYGGKFLSAGAAGVGVQGNASAAVAGTNYGGKFFAAGGEGRGVYGEASFTGGYVNYGGKFKAAGRSGVGVYGEASHANPTDSYGGKFLASGKGTGIYASGGSSGYAAIFRGNVKILSENSGLTIVEIGEGLDYAEGFDVSQPADINPGAVMIIDPKNPGKLTLSRAPYDTKVAGIVAGSNNLGSGVRLGGDRFGHDVALAGRVYCNVDATKIAVKTGDLLTTSATPGFAMKATDYRMAQGAILGKAMEKLDKGEKGQILVLVTLQ